MNEQKGLAQMKDAEGFTVRDQDKYQIRSTGYSSDRFGACECCGKHVSEVFILNHQMRYDDPELGPSWTYYGNIGMKFGHEACLKRLVAAFVVAVA